MSDVSVVSTPMSVSTLSIYDAFKNAFGSLVFRRVKEVHIHAPKVLHVVKVGEDGNPAPVGVVSQSNAHTISRDEMEKNVIELCSSYYFLTQLTPLRESDTYGKISLHGKRANKVELDVSRMALVGCSENQRQVMPRVGDLICGRVAKTKSEDGKDRYHFSQWFICSDQFLHAWTAILYPECVSLRRYEDDDDAKVRRYLMSGNRLCTNSYLKYMAGAHDSGVAVPLEERRKRFYVLRTEETSITHVHIYAALVLMIRYHELPSEHNVPNNLNGDPKLKGWSLPAGWLEMMVQRYAIEIKTPQVPTDDGAPLVEGHGAPSKTADKLIKLQDAIEFPTIQESIQGAK